MYPQSCHLFMPVRLQGRRGSSQSVKHWFLKNIWLFKYDPTGENKQWADSAVQLQKCPIS